MVFDMLGTHEHGLGMMNKPFGMLKKLLEHQTGQMTHSVVICGLKLLEMALRHEKNLAPTYMVA